MMADVDQSSPPAAAVPVASLIGQTALSMFFASLGAFAVVSLFFVYIFFPSGLDMRRDVWDVATPTERQMIRQILYRSGAPLSRIRALDIDDPYHGPPPGYVSIPSEE